jgi:hypothetical protein
MTDFYYQTMDTMYKAGVDHQYIDGWACGYLHNPPRGQQYLTEAYEAGYADGREEKPDAFSSWVATH